MSLNRLNRRVDNQRGKRELFYVLTALLFLATAICTVWFVQGVLGVKGDSIIAALLILPLALYLSISGRVRELSAGGLSAKLNEASQEPVSYAATDCVQINKLWKSDPNQPIRKTNPDLPKVVTLTHGSMPYRRNEVLDRLKSLATMCPVSGLVILDNRERVLAYMSYRSALTLFQGADRGDQFINLVNTKNPDAFDADGSFSAIMTETLSHTTTNSEALAAMEKTGLDTLIVVDRKGRFEGVVTRDRILSRIVMSLISNQ